MPDASNIKKFTKALKTGKTDITRALDRLFANPQDLQNDPNLGALRIAGALTPLPGWAATALGPDVSPAEIAHINSWPPQQKEDLRQKLVEAIDNTLPLRFFWELHRGNDEETAIPPPGAGGDITFRSPRKKVRVVSAVTYGEIKVDVG